MEDYTHYIIANIKTCHGDIIVDEIVAVTDEALRAYRLKVEIRIGQECYIDVIGTAPL